MVILGALINGVLTIAGGILGLLFKRRVSKELGDFLMSGLGLCIVLVAVQGMAGEGDVVVAIISMVIGGIIGFAVDIDKFIHRLGDWVQEKILSVSSEASAFGSFSESFVACTLVICVGSMAILGSFQSGLLLDHSTLIAKGIIDMVLVMVAAATMGVGAPFSGVCVFLYEAALSLAASLLSPLLTDAVITEMVCTGSLLLLALGLNMLKLTDIKVANFLPAAVLPMAICPIMNWLVTLF